MARTRGSTVTDARIRDAVLVAGWILFAAAAAGLAVVGAVKNADTLGTIALPLAILAFIIQIVVFIAQAWESQQVTTQTTGLLAEVQTSVRGMERLLEKQYSDLFQAYATDRGRETASQDSSEPPPSPPASTGPDPASAMVLFQMYSWPSRAEAEAANNTLKSLSPRSLGLFRRHLDQEMNQRAVGSPWIGLWASPSYAPETAELVDMGLLAELPLPPEIEHPADSDAYYVVTELGRSTGRILTAGGEAPEELADILGYETETETGAEAEDAEPPPAAAQ